MWGQGQFQLIKQLQYASSDPKNDFVLYKYTPFSKQNFSVEANLLYKIGTLLYVATNKTL